MSTPGRKQAHTRPRIPHEAPKFVSYWKNRGQDWAVLEPHFGPSRILDDHTLAGSLLAAAEAVDGEALSLVQTLKRMSLVQRKRLATELWKRTEKIRLKKNG